MRSERIVLYMLCSVGMIATLSQLVFLPSIATIREELSATTLQVSLTVALYSLSLAVAQLVYGPLVDRWPPKTILMTGLSIFTISSFGIFLSESIHWIIAFRVLQALGVGAVGVCGNAIISDLFSGLERDQSISVFQMFHSVGAAVGPAFGATVGLFLNWRFSFLFLTLMVAGVMAVLLWKMPEGRKVSSFSFRSALRLLRAPHLVYLCLSAAGTSFVIQSFHTSLGFLFTDHFHIHAAWTGYAFMTIPLGVFTGSNISRNLLSRIEREKIVYIGLVALCASSGAFAALVYLFRDPAAVLAIIPNLYLVGVSLGIVFSVVTSMMVNWFPELRGTALSLLFFSRHLFATAGPMLTGFVIGLGHVPLAYAFISAAAFLALPTFVAGVRFSRTQAQVAAAASK
ncbi:MAG TPA: MFS transporter [Paenibacillus sp.]|nr:MFS transporter [Paenibacillus sp.]